MSSKPMFAMPEKNPIFPGDYIKVNIYLRDRVEPFFAVMKRDEAEGMERDFSEKGGRSGKCGTYRHVSVDTQHIIGFFVVRWDEVQALIAENM